MPRPLASTIPTVPTRLIALACTLLLLSVGLAVPAAAQTIDPDTVCPPAEPLEGVDFGGEGGVHAGSIECLAQYGVVSGKADGTFGAAESLRRDQMATIIAGFIEVARGEPLAAGTASFDDVAATNTHVDAIRSLASAASSAASLTETTTQLGR